MTGETIERVAKAIFAKAEGSFAEDEPDFYCWENWPEDGRQASLAHAHYSREDYREFARAAIEAMPTPWQPISTAPRDGTPILIWVCGRFHEAVWEGEYGDNWERSEIDGAWQIRWAELNSYGVTPDEPPTHWAPRPEPPPGLSYED